MVSSSSRRRDPPTNSLPQQQQRQERKAKREETILFFVSAVGCTLGWTAVLSNLVYYTNTLGINSYLILNVCIYAPLFPMTLAQTIWDAEFDRQFTSLWSFAIRGNVGFGIMVLCTGGVAVASARQSLWQVSTLSLGLGMASAALHGTLKQMASFVYPGCGRLAAAVTAGLQASAVLVLLVSLMVTPAPASSSTDTTTNNNDTPSSHHQHHDYWLYSFYGTISFLILCCWLCFKRLMTHSQDVYRSMLRRDSSIQLSTLAAVSAEAEQDVMEEAEEGGNTMTATRRSTNDCQQEVEAHLLPGGGRVDQDCRDEQQELIEPLLLSTSSSSEAADYDTAIWTSATTTTCHPSQQQPHIVIMPTMMQLLRQSWPLCVALFLTVASSMAVASWFNRVPSKYPNLPQVLFYTRLFADLLARPATLLLPSSSSSPSEAAIDTTDDNDSDNHNNNYHNNDNVDDYALSSSSLRQMSTTANSSHRNSTTTLWCLMTLVIGRLLFVPYFFLYTMNHSASSSSSRWWTMIPHSDVGMIIGVFFFAFGSGFLVTWVYQLAPQFCIMTNHHHPCHDPITTTAALVTPLSSTTTANSSTNDAILLHQTNLLNVCFSASVLLGLMGSLSLSGYGTTS